MKKNIVWLLLFIAPGFLQGMNKQARHEQRKKIAQQNRRKTTNNTVLNPSAQSRPETPPEISETIPFTKILFWYVSNSAEHKNNNAPYDYNIYIKLDYYHLPSAAKDQEDKYIKKHNVSPLFITNPLIIQRTDIYESKAASIIEQAMETFNKQKAQYVTTQHHPYEPCIIKFGTSKNGIFVRNKKNTPIQTLQQYSSYDTDLLLTNLHNFRLLVIPADCHILLKNMPNEHSSNRLGFIITQYNNQQVFTHVHENLTADIIIAGIKQYLSPTAIFDQLIYNVVPYIKDNQDEARPLYSPEKTQCMYYHNELKDRLTEAINTLQEAIKNSNNSHVSHQESTEAPASTFQLAPTIQQTKSSTTPTSFVNQPTQQTFQGNNIGGDFRTQRTSNTSDNQKPTTPSFFTKYRNATLGVASLFSFFGLYATRHYWYENNYFSNIIGRVKEYISLKKFSWWL